ncbi:MAG: hypothetical protein IT307_05905 [Chloroflexi bacterium]|nr:hypothetical protein [Chloroflexota bacterium]
MPGDERHARPGLTPRRLDARERPRVKFVTAPATTLAHYLELLGAARW